MQVKTVLSHLNGRQVEAFYVLLISSGKYTFLPELYDIFGRENTIKFLEVFAGCKVSVPRVEVLEQLARDVNIYIRIEQAPAYQKASIIQSLAAEYSVTEDRIRTLHAQAKKTFENEFNFKVMKKYHA